MHPVSPVDKMRRHRGQTLTHAVRPTLYVAELVQVSEMLIHLLPAQVSYGQPLNWK